MMRGAEKMWYRWRRFAQNNYGQTLLNEYVTQQRWTTRLSLADQQHTLLCRGIQQTRTWQCKVKPWRVRFVGKPVGGIETRGNYWRTREEAWEWMIWSKTSDQEIPHSPYKSRPAFHKLARMSRRKRHNVKGWMWELPKGGIYECCATCWYSCTP